MYRLIVEAILVGIMVVIIGNIVGFLLSKIKTISPVTDAVCKDWNKYYIMEISLFVTGVFVHLLCELIGLNKWYCKNGYACMK